MGGRQAGWRVGWKGEGDLNLLQFTCTLNVTMNCTGISSTFNAFRHTQTTSVDKVGPLFALCR